MDLMDGLDALLPRVEPAAEAREILTVMARISRASSAAVFWERSGRLRWLAGDHLSEEISSAIKRTWRSQRKRVLTGTAFTELDAASGEARPVRSWLMWLRRPADGGLDAVYFAGPGLRPIEACSSHLLRLGGLLLRLE
jgi:hypothetical protein